MKAECVHDYHAPVEAKNHPVKKSLGRWDYKDQLIFVCKKCGHVKASDSLKDRVKS